MTNLHPIRMPQAASRLAARQQHAATQHSPLMPCLTPRKLPSRNDPPSMSSRAARSCAPRTTAPATAPQLASPSRPTPPPTTSASAVFYARAMNTPPRSFHPVTACRPMTEGLTMAEIALLSICQNPLPSISPSATLQQEAAEISCKKIAVNVHIVVYFASKL